MPLHFPGQLLHHVVVVDVVQLNPVKYFHVFPFRTVRLLPDRDLEIIKFANQPLDRMSEHGQHPSLVLGIEQMGDGHIGGGRKYDIHLTRRHQVPLLRPQYGLWLRYDIDRFSEAFVK